MTLKPTIALTAVAGVALLAAAGCLKRKETITVAPDGSVQLALEYESENRDFGAPDAMPSVEGGWQVAVVTHRKKDDSEEYTLTAERTVAPGEELPSTFAIDGDPDGDLYLHFPTEVWTEQRQDGLYFHFRRVYSPRKWAYIQYWQDFWIDDHIKKITDKPAEELTRDDRIQVLQALAAVEAHKQLEFARIALGECDPQLPVEHWLLARTALFDFYKEELDWNALGDLYGQTPDEQRDERFAREAERILAAGYATLVDSLRASAGYDSAQVARFDEAYERAQRYYEITKETGGHYFEIHVRMPGQIVAHNADRIDDDEAVWEFEGKAFRDRPYELLITSRLRTNNRDLHD